VGRGRFTHWFPGLGPVMPLPSALGGGHFETARSVPLSVPELAMGLCPSVSVSVTVSVTSRCSIETAERIELVFGT